MPNARKTAVTALLKVENDSAYSNIALNSVLNESGLEGSDRAFASALFYGVLDRRITLDYVLSLFIKTPLKKVAPFTLTVLRLAVWQIMFSDKIPDSAAVNEAVKLVKNSREGRNAGFVNAVLRNIIRSQINLPEDKSVKSLSVRYSCPEWIINSFIKDYGYDNALLLLKESLKTPPLTVRVNTIITDRSSLMKELIKQGIPCEETDTENALVITGGMDISGNDLYKSGFFYAEDTASQKAMAVLSPSKGERMLDMCAAPGGKSFTAAQYMENTGEITACDLYPKRTALIEKGAQRLGIRILKSVCQDALVHNDSFGLFDCVLCDVPCSGLGVMRRKPEIKYKPETDLEPLEKTQLKILENAASYLKEKGRIMYSTCTLRKAENENLVKTFLLEYNGFHKAFEHTFMPHTDGTDGFYCALLVKD